MGRAAAFSAKMEARSGVWLLLLLSIGVFVQAAPSGDLLERLDNHDLDALVEIDEEQPEKADAAQERKAPIDDLAKQAKQANEEERDRKDSKDPYKQRKTYTKAMKKYEKRTKWEKEHPVVRNGKKRKFDPLNDFKKATLSAVDRSVLRIKERGRKDAAKLKRIRKAIIRRDKREKTRQRKDDSRLTKEKRKPKLAIKHRIEKVMSDEDKKLEKDPRKASPEAIAAVERSAQPVRKKAYGASYRSEPP